ncbi:hypothetical protein B23_0584 [Geobacillus thermoleovorans B23]|nr:hypothetical protein B23_0584 [Geobacillus thermoleovorans B23]
MLMFLFRCFRLIVRKSWWIDTIMTFEFALVSVYNFT